MNYTLNQLRIFAMIAEKQSITKAAEALYLTQPAVSIQLKKFQDQFEVPLTQVVGKKIFITEFGREIAMAAQKILAEVYEIRHKAQAYKGLLTGKLSVAVVSTGANVLPYFLSGFLHLNPGVELRLDVSNKQKVVQAIADHSVDCALISILPEAVELDVIELMENRLYLVGRTGDRLKVAQQSKDVISTLPLITREQGSGTRHMVEKFMQQNGLKAQQTLELTYGEAVKHAVLAGMGYAVLPLVTIKNELQNGTLEIIHLDGFPMRSVWSLVKPQSVSSAPVVEAFWEYVSNQKSKIIGKHFAWMDAL